MWCRCPRLRARCRLLRQRRARGKRPRGIDRRTALVELSGVPPCAERLPPAPPSGTRHPGTASMSTRTGITTFHSPIVTTVPDAELDDVAEADAPRLVAAELNEGDLVSGDEQPAALLGAQREDGGAVRAQCRREVAFDLLRGRVRVHDELTRDGLDPDLDFHGAPDAWWVVGVAAVTLGRVAVLAGPR